MLHEFLHANERELIERCRRKAARRSRANAPPVHNEHGIPIFLRQLIETFRGEQTPEALARLKTSGHGTPSLALVPSGIAGTAARHGIEMQRQGLTIDQVVHDYGDLCQALTELAMERDVPITVDEFHTFNRCLDDAIADAVTAYSGDAGDAEAHLAGDWTGTLAKMRARVEMALLSFTAIKAGGVGLKGTTAAMHENSLSDLRELLDLAVAQHKPGDPDSAVPRAIISPAAPR